MGLSAGYGAHIFSGEACVCPIMEKRWNIYDHVFVFSKAI